MKRGRTGTHRSHHVPLGQKPGRKRKRRGGPEAPSGAGHISVDRANRTGFRREGLRGSAGAAGGMVDGGSSAVF